MERSWYYRLILVLAVVILSAYYVAPSLVYFSADPEVRRSKEKLAELMPKWFPKKRMNLGIDLQGGLHLVMGVDTEKAVQDRADRIGDDLVAEMKDKGKTLKSVTRPGDRPELAIEMVDAGDWAVLKEILEQRKDTWDIRSHLGASVTYVMNETYEQSLREDAVAQALKTLRNRIDAFGVKEADVRKRGTNSIIIQIAGITADEEEAIKNNIIGKTAQLEFKVVDDESNYFADVAAKGLPEGVKLEMDSYRGKDDAIVTSRYLEAGTKEELQKAVALLPPSTDRAVRYQEMKLKDGKKRWRTWLLERKTRLTGDSLVDAHVAFDSDKSNYFVSMRFDQKGAKIFERLTRENVKRRMAIVLDELVDSAPVIQDVIPSGNASITLGGYKNQNEILQEARDLAVVLKAGALPAPVYPQEQRTVGASLGDDAVQKGKAALTWTTLIIVALMIGYYRGSGVVGVVALAVNMLLLLAALSLWGATLTLPGLAGLALTVGMAVDANIIQFERIREELRSGKTARTAVDAGFDKAFSAIFDSNVTTLLSAIVLMQWGSGPIKGFGTTLFVGVAINTFTAVIVPRLILDYVAHGRKAQTISI